MRTLPFLILLLMGFACMPTNHAQTPSALHIPNPGSPERAAVLDSARDSIDKEIGRTVQFVVERLAVEGQWAFLYAHMQASDGGPVDYSRTSMAEAAEAGFVSQVYAGLLEKEDGHWVVRAQAIGPTDMAWQPWAADYGAPEALFKLD